jgi:hypothetical protein
MDELNLDLLKTVSQFYQMDLDDFLEGLSDAVYIRATRT